MEKTEYGKTLIKGRIERISEKRSGEIKIQEGSPQIWEPGSGLERSKMQESRIPDIVGGSVSFGSH